MKLTLDPMPALRLSATAKANAWFNQQARPHIDAAHTAKRTAAQAGAPYPDWFTAEAILRSITPEALATLVNSKPDTQAARELHRQRVMAAIDAAKTPVELESISQDVTRLA